MAAEPSYDLLLKGGHVVDPANDIDARTDVAIRDNRIAAVGIDLPGNAVHEVDVSGLWVVPGLLDIHIHSYYTRRTDSEGLFGGSLNADAHFRLRQHFGAGHGDA